MRSSTPFHPVGRVALIAGLALLAACREEGTGGVYSDLSIEWINAESRVINDRAPQFDFGTVFMGQTETRTLKISNNGSVEMTLESLTVSGGDAQLVGFAVDEAGKTFRVPFEVGASIPGGGFREFELVYSPSVDESVLGSIDHQVVLTLATVGGRDDEANTALITLKGRAVSGACEIQSPVEFGWVAKNNTMTKTVRICNDATIEATAFIDTIQSNSGDDLAFRYAAESAQGNVAIPPGSCTEAVIDFTPTQEKTYFANVYMQASEQCPLVPVELNGRGVDAVLRWRVENLEKCIKRDAHGVCQDNFIECGAVTPNTVAVERAITFENMGTSAVLIDKLAFNANKAIFSLKAEDGSVPTQVEVPARQDGSELPGEAQLTATCKPVTLGLAGAILLGETSGDGPRVNIQTRVFGGGPDIETAPSTLMNFGPVAYFPDASPAAFQERRIIIRNVGSTVTGAGPESNLHLGQMNSDGSRSPPYWEVIPGENTAAGEFTVTLDGELPANGLAARAGENSIAARVRVTPGSLGLKQATLRIFSNDPDAPAYEVTLSADARQLPPCQFAVSPPSLNFGMVGAGTSTDNSFVFRNLGAPQDLCLVSNIQMAAGSDPTFKTPEYPASEPNFREVAGGESVSVMVRAQPEGEATGTIKTVTGEVEFYVSSPTTPQVKVPVRADLGVACLTVTPNDLDFGIVQVACNSAVRSFNIYNSCASPVTVFGIDMQAAAGLPGNTGACTTAAACPEFFKVAQDAIPPSTGKVLRPGDEPIKFQAKYKPLDFGTDIGAVAINAQQNGVPVNYMVTLRGTGDTVGENTDVYGQDQRRKADILFVIDNSGSMSPYQEMLGANFEYFIKYARTSDVDFRLAATSTDMDGTPPSPTNYGSDDGRFRPVPVSGEKILTKSTPNVEEKFLSLVTSFGANGSASEQTFRPAYRALTELSTTDNAGFLRSDALLAIVGLSDEEEQSDPETAVDWHGLLNNIKGVNRANMFTFNMIGPYAPVVPNSAISACGSMSGGTDKDRYSYVVHATNGLEMSICEQNWNRVLEEIGKVAVGYRTDFFLNSVPDLTATKGITVTITDDAGNVTNVPATSDEGGTTVTNWTYDPVGNAVSFDPFAVPEPGETLAITYTTICYGD